MSEPHTPDPSTLRELIEHLERRARERTAARSMRHAEETPGQPETAAEDRGSSARAAELLKGLSLLWPPERASKTAALSSVVPERTAVDLEVPYLVAQIAPKRRYAPFLDKLLRSPLQDEETIRYRQGIVADIAGCRELRICCRLLAEQAVASSESFRLVHEDRPRLFFVAMRLSELQDFVDSVDALNGAMAKAEILDSRGLRVLRERLGELARTGWYLSLRRTVTRLLTDIRDIRSVTVGINLDSELKPVEATLLSINRDRFRSSRFLDSILGKTGEEERRGIAELHSMLAQRPGLALPIAPPLFRDLAAILDQMGRDMERELAAFSGPSVDFVTALKQELVFYASAVSLEERLGAAGLPVCRPTIAEREERVTVLKDAYNVNLAFRMLEHGAGPGSALVRNDALLEDPLRIAVLTGPNNGGKSVYLQAIGLAQLLAQCGMSVPALSATISVCDSIVTHYQTEERPDKEIGRLNEEAARLRDSLELLSRSSLLLSSETFSSTGSSEAAYLLYDVLRALQRLGARAVFSTHLHELAELVERDASLRSGETQVANLVALFDEEDAQGRPTYRIVRDTPRGRSYAESVARGLGIGYEQLLQSFERSGKLRAERGAKAPRPQGSGGGGAPA